VIAVSVRLLSLVLALSMTPAVMLAQVSSSPSPRGGGFGSANESASRDRLDLSASIIEALETEAAPELRARLQNRSPQSGGYSSMFTGSMDYERRRRRMDVSSQVVSAVQYYPQLGRFVSLSHGAAIGTTVRLQGKSTLDLTQTADYSPSYFYRLFPSVAPPTTGAVAPSAPDYRIDESRSFANSTLASLALGDPRGSRLTVSAEHQSAVFHGGANRPDLDTLAGRAKFARGLGRTATVAAEYERRAGQFGYGGHATEQRLRFTGSISPALSTSRRAQFSGSVSPSTIDVDVMPGGEPTAPKRRRIEGDASVQYPFLRSWSLGGSYRRGTEYVALFREPIIRNTARLEVAGLAASRVDVSAVGGYTSGASALRANTEPFGSYTGAIRGRYAVTRSLATYVEYLYYRYDLRGQTTLAPDLPSVFEQHGVRIGLTLWTRPLGR
jgi:hypothetical protein